MRSMTSSAPIARGARAPGFLTRVLNWMLDEDDEELTRDEARRRMRSRPGLLASLSPEALELIRNYDGPENHGPPLTRRERRDLAERIRKQQQPDPAR